MKPSFRCLCVASAVLALAGCDKPTPPAAVTPPAAETDGQLAEARDALQRQALEIETKTALMDKQLAEMAQSLKDRENAQLRDSLDTLKRQNDDLRAQADAARRQSDSIAQRMHSTPPLKTPPPVALPDYSLFYERLSPYGRWFEVNGYGYCWRPTITVAGWRPYVDGCWVWSSLGWAWQSNEPFGWATYHYGRWLNLARYGWVWVPGSEWAPAWVAWRQSRDCVGWAPLPPEPGACSGVYRDCDSRYGLGPASYTFIETTQFVSPTYINVYAPVTRQTTIFQHSVNVTQIVPSRGQGHAFTSHGGPPRVQMEQACGRSVPQRQVEAVRADQVPLQRHPHGRMEPAAPLAMVQLPAAQPGARIVRPEVKDRIQQPTRMSGFEGVPQREVTEIRESLAREKEAAAVQQRPFHGRMPNLPSQQAADVPAVVNGAPAPRNEPPQETRTAAVQPTAAAPVTPEKTTEAEPRRPGYGSTQPHFSRRAGGLQVIPAVPAAPAQEGVRPERVPESGSGAKREPERQAQTAMDAPRQPEVRAESKNADSSVPAATPSVPPVAAATAAVPAAEPGTVTPAVPPPPAMTETKAAEPAPATAAAEAGIISTDAARERTRAHERRQREIPDRAMTEPRTAEQAAANAEAEKSRMQAAAQQEAQAAQQQRMAADQAAAAEAEKVRQQAEAAAAQQRAAAERMSAEQAATAQAAAVQQRQQEEMQRAAQEQARRAAEGQQMRAQQETAQRAQEMAQRQAEETARRQQEAEMQRAQEQARRAAEEQQMRAQQETAQRAQEMAQRQAEETARRQQEAEMQRAQEQARRAAEEQQMRVQQEAAQRVQEMAQRQAEETARQMQRAQEQARRAAEEQQMRAQQEAAQRAQEMAQRQAEEQARRAAEEQQMRVQQEAAQRVQEMAQRQAEETARQMQRAQEQARRAAEEQQMRAQQEAAQRAQEMAQRQAEEQARRAAAEQQMRAQQEAVQRAQEMAQRQAEEQARRAQEEAQRAAAEAARNRPPGM
ncbi:DUF6600 domain-containing protein [Prosthecobacter fluviatilis]|uniref:DUF6600 domain-containing protein n=1 Tax=Prosthecobacter fluviatilis TaxID=445931 RepID=A0ABW0KRC9_9BACT